MANQLVKQAMKRKSAVSPAPPKGVRQTESMGGMRSMSPNSTDMEIAAREDARTLHEAHKIRNDKARMSAVTNHVMSLSQALGGDVKVSDKKTGRK